MKIANKLKIFIKIILRSIARNYLLISYLIAFSAIVISLYYSEVLQLPACNLCWYQRILMYPIAPVSILAFIFKDKYGYRYLLSLAFPGLLFAVYHYFIQKTSLFPDVFCGAAISCTNIQIEYLGFITIPLMSALGFLAIIAVNLLALRQNRSNK